jgi:hypothetical protein
MTKKILPWVVALAAMSSACGQAVVTPEAGTVSNGAMDLWQFAKAGGVVMIPLGVLSVITLMLIII